MTPAGSLNPERLRNQDMPNYRMTQQVDVSDVLTMIGNQPIPDSTYRQKCQVFG